MLKLWIFLCVRKLSLHKPLKKNITTFTCYSLSLFLLIGDLAFGFFLRVNLCLAFFILLKGLTTPRAILKEKCLLSPVDSSVGYNSLTDFFAWEKYGWLKNAQHPQDDGSIGAQCIYHTLSLLSVLAVGWILDESLMIGRTNSLTDLTPYCTVCL